MKHTYKFSFLFLLFFWMTSLVQAQTPTDHWLPVYSDQVSFNMPARPARTTTSSSTGYFSIFNAYPFNNKLFIYGDTGTYSYYQPSSSIQVFDPQNQSMTVLSYTPSNSDNGIISATSVNTNTTGLSYVFFGAGSTNSEFPTLYKYNSTTGAITSRDINDGNGYDHHGLSSLAEYNNSAATTHDSLIIFASYAGHYNVYKQHYSQDTFRLANDTLNLSSIVKSMVFKNTLYVLGTDNVNYRPAMFTSTDGTTYTADTAYASAVAALGYYNFTSDMDTLNGNLYIALSDGEGSSMILKTADGVTFTNLKPSAYTLLIHSLKGYKQRLWIGAEATDYSYRPAVYYLDGSYNALLSVDSLGETGNQGASYRLALVHDSLYTAGNYQSSNYPLSTYGNYIYKLTLPQAGLIIAKPNVCFGNAVSPLNTSQNTDSVRWFMDNNYYASTVSFPSLTFTTVGTHTVGVIAIGGTFTDTAMTTVNVYSVTVNIAGPASVCQGDSLQLNSTNTGMAPFTYNWTQAPLQFSVAPTTPSITIIPPFTGNGTYDLQVMDGNGCLGDYTFSVTVNPSTDINGTVTSGSPALPVAGNVILYKYEPYYTKFDSVDYRTLDASGSYTFSSQYSGNYILKAVPSASSLQITYGDSAINWKTARVVTHGCINAATENINVLPYATLAPGGHGSMSGYIYGIQGYHKTTQIQTPGNPIPGIVVKGGKNPGAAIFGQTTTSSTGYYSFTGLPAGNYFVLVDIPGLDTNSTYHLVINDNDTTHLDFTVDSVNITPIQSTPTSVNEILMADNLVKVFPNPSNDAVNIQYSLLSGARTEILIYDMLGKQIRQVLPESFQQEGDHKQQISVADMTAGAYFIKIRINSKEAVIKLFVSK